MNSQESSVGDSLPPNTKLRLISGIAAGVLLGAAVIYFSGQFAVNAVNTSLAPENAEVPKVLRSAEKTTAVVSTEVQASRESDIIPPEAVIVSDIELIYDNRSKSPSVAAVLKKAAKAFGKLEKEVAAKLRELNKHKMNRKSYTIARDAIYTAKQEHISKDPLCQLALKEKEIQKFLAYGKSRELSAPEVENFKKMLDSRQNLMDKLASEGHNEQKR